MPLAKSVSSTSDLSMHTLLLHGHGYRQYCDAEHGPHDDHKVLALIRKQPLKCTHASI